MKAGWLQLEFWSLFLRSRLSARNFKGTGVWQTLGNPLVHAIIMGIWNDERSRHLNNDTIKSQRSEDSEGSWHSTAAASEEDLSKQMDHLLGNKGVWRDLVNRWNSPTLRNQIADSITRILAMIWEDAFINIYNLAHLPTVTTASKASSSTVSSAVSSSLSASSFLATLRPNKHHNKNIMASGHWTRTVFERHLNYVIGSTKVSSTALILALQLVHRLRAEQHDGSRRGGEGSEYRLYFVGLMLANKYTEDHPYTNKAWASIIGIPSREINIMEREFLAALNYELFVGQAEFQLWTVNLSRLFCWSRQQINWEAEEQASSTVKMPTNYQYQENKGFYQRSFYTIAANKASHRSDHHASAK